MTGKIHILEERRDKYIIQTDDGISTAPRTSYFELKYSVYDGNRIFHKFNDALRVEETYNDGIFNAYDGERTIQISDADSICRHILKGDAKSFLELFIEWYSIKAEADVIKAVFSAWPHRIDLKSEPGCYVIDGVFMVDRRGTAHFREGGKWTFLCIVADSAMKKKTHRLPVLGGVNVSSLTMVVIAKIMFLLFPNSEDAVFIDQLDGPAREHVKILGRRKK